MAKRKSPEPLISDEPLPGGGARHRTHSLQKVGTDVLILRPSKGHWFFAIVLMVLGAGVTLFFGSYLLRDPQLIGWLVVGGGVVFFLAGLLVLMLASRWEFNGTTKFARRRWLLGGKTIPFASLKAIQFVDGGWHGGQAGQGLPFRSFQLNLVLVDGKRVNLTNHAEWNPTWEIGNELAEFLGVAVLDEVSEDAGG